MLNNPVREIRARVELYNGSTLLDTFRYNDRLIELSIERVGEDSKFFGFGVCQKLNVKLIDTNRELNISTAHTLDVAFGLPCGDYIYTFPLFYISEVHRDEETNELSITAYDAIYEATKHDISELALVAPYTIADVAKATAALLGVPMKTVNVDLMNEEFTISFESGANFGGNENLREVLNAIAEATQTIYYISSEWELVFKRLDKTGAAVLEIDKAKYISLQSGDNRRLAAVCHATELGDNVISTTGLTGTTQYVRDNPFWDLRNDIADIVDSAVSRVGGLTINQFNLDWRGNFLLEIGDKIAIQTKDNNFVSSYVLNDIIKYNGFYSQQTEWKYTDNAQETAANPTTLGGVLKQTYARVDKANKTIDLVVSDNESNKEVINALQLNTDGISASVKTLETNTSDSLNSLNESLSNLSSEVSAKMSAEDVQLEIKKELENGTGKVITSTGFKFDETGLNISKTGSEMTTTITEDGMTVYKDNSAVLTANNIGVDAVNLHATTYLIIGTNSRFEDFESTRTGCFWIGG